MTLATLTIVVYGALDSEALKTYWNINEVVDLSWRPTQVTDDT